MISIQAKDFSFRYLHQPEGEKALSNLSFEIEEASVVGVIGRAGAGKSTLVKSLNGLVPKVDLGYQEGDIIVDGLNTRHYDVNQLARHVGIVLQNPEVQIFSLTVGDDVAFGPANLGLPREEIFRRVSEAIQAAELEHLVDRNPNEISGGEQQCLAIAGILAMEPKIMAFDEPISMLDPIGKQRVMSILRQVTRRAGTTSITTESGADIEAVAEVVDRLIAIDQGEILIDGDPSTVLQDERIEQIGVGRPQVTELFLELKKRGVDFPRIPITLAEAKQLLEEKLRQLGVKQLLRPPDFCTRPPKHFGPPIVEVENIHHFYNPQVHALKGVSFTIPERQIVGIIGQNGSGKTTLARHLVGLLKPTNKDAIVKVKSIDIRKLRLDKIIRMINYVFQNPDDQLFAETIWEEIAFAPRMIDLPEEEIKRLTEEAMKVFDLEPHKDRYIFGLDEDLKTYLSISCILPLKPDVLLIDEPTTGLDEQGEVKMMRSLKKLRDEMGKTIVIITHNMKTVGNHCDRVLVMSKGHLIMDGTPREVFAQSERLLEADILPPQITRLGQALASEFGCPRDVLTVEEMAEIIDFSIHREMSGA
ncbi:MAG: energy-coupling factor transporter ATPase [Anaerolineales bacterium]|nr:energy-coupling factor transporter ATPase [Anaerolineales bacterium]MDW8161239.1 energy-coupling factor transporter ATPase [Anaerolineales bacterium]